MNENDSHHDQIANSASDRTFEEKSGYPEELAERTHAALEHPTPLTPSAMLRREAAYRSAESSAPSSDDGDAGGDSAQRRPLMDSREQAFWEQQADDADFLRIPAEEDPQPVEWSFRSDEAPTLTPDMLKWQHGAPSEGDTPDWSGCVLGNFRLVRKLADGGTSSVYLAKELGVGAQLAAVKVLLSSFSPDGRRFELEVDVLSRLDHPQIVKVWDSGRSSQGLRYIVMPFIEGLRSDEWAGVLRERSAARDAVAPEERRNTAGDADLEVGLSNDEAAVRSRTSVGQPSITRCDLETPDGVLAPSPAGSAGSHSLENTEQDFAVRAVESAGDQTTKSPSSAATRQSRGSLPQRPVRAIVEMMLKVARAIDYAHQQGILHRDLKPSNILITAGDEPIVTDFGLARRIDASDLEELTRTGIWIGSLGFMPPEQMKWSRNNSDSRLDVYGFGATLFFLLTGQTPIRTESNEVALEDLFHRPVPSLRKFNPQVSIELDAICRKCLEKLPEHRYPDMEAVTADLNAYLLQQPVQARRVSQWTRVARWSRREPGTALMLLGVAVGLFVAAITFAGLWRSSQVQKQKVQENLNTALAIIKSEHQEAQRFLPHTPGSLEYRVRRLESAVEFLQQLVEQHPEDRQVRRSLAVAYYLLGAVPLREGRDAERTASLERAEEIFSELAEQDPHDHQSRFDVFHTRLYLNEISFVSLEDRVQKTLVNLALIRDLATEFPDRPEYADAQAHELNRAALFLLSLPTVTPRDLEAAAEFAAEAIAIGQSLMDRFPDRPRFARQIINGRRAMGDILLKEGKVAQAGRWAAGTVPIVQKMMAQGEPDADDWGLLANVYYQNMLIAILDFRDGDAQVYREETERTLEIGEQSFPELTLFYHLRNNLKANYLLFHFQRVGHPHQAK